MTAIASRRSFLAASGLVLGFALPARGLAQVEAPGSGGVLRPNAFVRVGADNIVTVVAKHIEMGQGPSTGIATLIADEMDADWAQMRLAFAPNNDDLYKNLQFGTMATGGSSAMAESWMQMRTAGAAARAMLVAAAARRWGVDPAAVTVAKGVVSAGGMRASFGDLAADAATLPVPDKPILKTPDRFVYIGKSFPKVDSLAKTNGSAVFTHDIRRPNMVHTAILHAPAFGGKLVRVDDAAARVVTGVIDVKTIPQGVVVYARDSWSAQKGRTALKAEWDLSGAETRSSEEMYRTYAAAARTPGTQAEAEGNIAKALAGSANRIEATYYFPFLAHAPMEPMDAVIERQGDRCHVWAGSQFQVGDCTAIARTLGLRPDQVVLHQQYAGGSFGRRATPTMQDAVEAASAFNALGGDRPVKHAWTRENDITGGRYRPLAVHHLKGGLDATGAILAWDQVVAVQSFMKGTPFGEGAIKNGIDPTMIEGAVGDYHYPNMRLGFHMMENGVPALWWRSVGSTHTAYASETFLDELLALGRKDPVEGRLALMKDDRLKAVTQRVAEMSGFGRRLPEGRAKGSAAHKSFGTYVAQVAEVSAGPGGIPRVHKVWCAVDCGLAINPDVIRAQMEGGIGFGLGHALFAEITLGQGGRVEQSNFDTYPSLRMGDMPAVEVAIMPSTEAPTGVGEPGVPPIAPAVANAWRRLTGKAVRRLPFTRGVTA